MDKSVSHPINILIIGNNPVELSRIRNKFKNLKGPKFIADFCFSTRDSLLKITKSKPGCILVDDNLDKDSIAELSSELNKKNKTKNIPITLLKTSYKNQKYIPGISDFLLKDSLSGESMSKAIINVIKSRKSHRYLYIKYKKNQRKLNQLFRFSSGKNMTK